MSTLHTNQWLAKRGKSLALFIGLVWLLVAYAFVSAAINSGSLWEYAGALFFLVWGLRYFLFLGRAIAGGKKHQATKA